MSYVVTARKYRPQTFDELVGQEHIAGTLKNAIVKGRVGHAYLFSGPRGVGKTSAARILAKALNCERGPTPQPCGSCTFCREITEGRSLDLVEIDGASNRRIDEVRQLRENVRFVPSSARYKIYIIDEIHMLTPEAFNALLKTLEEPPDHVIFIFATTEIHKVPSTIRSRCQQFVFKRIPVPRIIEMLKKILSDVDVAYEEKALFWIARNAAGSMRDAESILDQMISYSEGTIKENDVFYVLGMPRYDVYHSLATAIADQDYSTCFEQLDSLIRDGTEVTAVITGLIEYFKNAYVLGVTPNAAGLIDLPTEDIEYIQSLRFSPADLQNLLVLLSRLYLDARNSDLIREFFEITLIKMANYRDIVHPASLVKRLEALKIEMEAVGGYAEQRNGQGEGGGVSIQEPGTGTQDPAAPAQPLRNRSDENKEESKKENKEERTVENEGKKSPEAGMEKRKEENKDKKSELDNEDLVKRIIRHFIKRRIALSEFLKRAKSFDLDDSLLTIRYDKTENLSYEHVSEASAKRYIEKETRDLLGRNIRVSVSIDRESGAQDDVEKMSPEISKVIEIFKGEIVPNTNTGGEG